MSSESKTPPPPPGDNKTGLWQKFRSWPKIGQIAVWVGVALVSLSLLGALVGDDSESGAQTAAGGSPSQASNEPAAEERKSNSNIATDDYTPHVSQGTPVVVDELTWRVTGSPYTASNLGTSELTGATANGIFVVVPMSVRNNKNETVTVTSSMVKLIAGGKEYESDSEGQFALIGSSQKSFFLEDIGPDLSQNGTVVFDVPQSALRSNPEVCVGELGFGPSQGCIALTSI